MTKFFVAIEFIFYMFFMNITCQEDGDTSLSIHLKFISICICCLYILIMTLRKQAHSLWSSLSFLFFVCSDYFLLLTDSYAKGLCMFLIVQLCFFMQIRREKMQRFLYISGVLVVATLILFLLSQSRIVLDATLILAVFYFILFFSNLIGAVNRARRTRSLPSRLFAIGLLLYFFCDLHVGIFQVSNYLSWNHPIFLKLYDFSIIAMWLFYLPGVVVIAISNMKALYEIK